MLINSDYPELSTFFNESKPVFDEVFKNRINFS